MFGDSLWDSWWLGRYKNCLGWREGPVAYPLPSFWPSQNIWKILLNLSICLLLLLLLPLLCFLFLNSPVSWVNNTTIFFHNLYTIWSTKSSDTVPNNTLWNSTLQTLNDRRHNDNLSPLRPPCQLPPLSILSKYNTIDNPPMAWHRNPIYVFGDDEVRCEGCWEEGHFIGDCNREYWFDGRQYVLISEGENLMEPTYIVDKDYYRWESPRRKQKVHNAHQSLVTLIFEFHFLHYQFLCLCYMHSCHCTTTVIYCRDPAHHTTKSGILGW